MTKSLNSMVLCMISVYHLMCLSQGPSYISPVLSEAAKDLLPFLEEYRAGSAIQGTWDARVLERAKTLWVAVWLHRLDMATTGDQEASYSLDTARHVRGPLLEFLLAPWVSNLTFGEVVDRVLVENRDKIAYWTTFRSSGLSSEGSWRTSSRLAKMSLTHLPRRG